MIDEQPNPPDQDVPGEEPLPGSQRIDTAPPLDWRLWIQRRWNYFKDLLAHERVKRVVAGAGGFASLLARLALQVWARVRALPGSVFLSIVVIAVVVSSFFFASSVGNVVRQKMFPSLVSAQQAGPSQATPTGQVDFAPAFPTPFGGQGTNQSSQPPSNGPIIFPTEEPTPEPGDPGTIQITSIPSQVTNNSTVQVSVETDQPGITVHLLVVYENQPTVPYSSPPAVTDDNGQATLIWSVHLSFRQGRLVTARVTAVATKPDGEVVSSDPVDVEVSVR